MSFFIVRQDSCYLFRNPFFKIGAIVKKMAKKLTASSVYSTHQKRFIFDSGLSNLLLPAPDDAIISLIP